MPITIPDASQIRFTAGMGSANVNCALPALLAQAATVNPGPKAIYTGGAAPNGQMQAIQALGDAGRAGYLGYGIERNLSPGQPTRPLTGVVIDGFSGVTVGAQVFVNDAGADASGTASGLTHTAPTTGADRNAIGVGVGTTKILIYKR